MSQGPWMQTAPPQQQHWLRRFVDSWATRSLAVGAMATVLDLLTVFVTFELLVWAKPSATSFGAVLGAIFTFFVNRHFAFRDHEPDFAPQMIKFLLTTAGTVAIHAGLVWVLSVQNGVNVYVAKLISDIAVFSVGQLFLLRYIVFPKAKPQPAATPLTSTMVAEPGVESTLRAG